MPKTSTAPSKAGVGPEMTPVVAATLAGVIYQAKIFNRQSRMNVPEDSIIREVVTLWRAVLDELDRGSK